MNQSWENQIKNAIEDVEKLQTILMLSENEKAEIDKVNKENAFRITPYYASLINTSKFFWKIFPP